LSVTRARRASRPRRRPRRCRPPRARTHRSPPHPPHLVTSKNTPDRALLLTPGASAGREQPALVAVEQALAPVPVERMDFPYRKAGRKSPDKAPVLIEAVREGAAALAKRTRLTPDRLALGGRSMGGRMCSMAVADGLAALGLALISYPLHPPGKPEKSRTEHLPRLDVPCL